MLNGVGKEIDFEKASQLVWDFGTWTKAKLDCGLVLFLTPENVDNTWVLKVEGSGLAFVESLEESRALIVEFKQKVVKERALQELKNE